MLLCPFAVDRKMRELTIQAAFDFRKNKILKNRADAKAERTRLRMQRMQELADAEFESTLQTS